MSELYDIFRRHPRISTDTRRIEPGSVFFALHGATFDGNRFAADALSKGAAYAVVDDPAAVSGDRTVLVGDTLEALQELAREHRRELAIPILAISGSNGKTTTKELVSRVLAERFEVYATHGNLNNHIGVPLTLLAMTRDTEFGVVEMGASACGEIALLASIAEPNYGILTNIGRAHLEGFGGPEGIRRGKGELLDYLAANGGRAFVPREDQTLTNMAAERDGLAAEYYSVTLADGIAHHLEGDYNRFNIAAAVAVGRYFDIDGDLEKGRAVVCNAKTRRVSVCNALDCLVIHRGRLTDLPELCAPLAGAHVTVYADEEAFAALDGHYPAGLLEHAAEEHFGTEFLDYKLAVKTVASLDGALAHIARYSSRHSEAIVTENKQAATQFTRSVDAACVYVNVSTAFTDGGQFGFGAEVGISTQKLHARGPMGLPELTTYKYIVSGDGQIRQP